jgi:hypothetical protein
MRICFFKNTFFLENRLGVKNIEMIWGALSWTLLIFVQRKIAFLNLPLWWRRLEFIEKGIRGRMQRFFNSTLNPQDRF